LVPGVNASLDHVQPRKLGGKDDVSNLAWVDVAVNFAKRDLTKDAFFELCREVASHGV
jgi:hypothetical protein